MKFNKILILFLASLLSEEVAIEHQILKVKPNEALRGLAALNQILSACWKKEPSSNVGHTNFAIVCQTHTDSDNSSVVCYFRISGWLPDATVQ